MRYRSLSFSPLSRARAQSAVNSIYEKHQDHPARMEVEHILHTDAQASAKAKVTAPAPEVEAPNEVAPPL